MMQNETHSVNTILLDENNNLIGENTDVFGFQAAYLKSANQEKKIKKHLFLVLVELRHQLF